MCITDVPLEELRLCEVDRRIAAAVAAARAKRFRGIGYEEMLAGFREIRAEVRTSWPSPSAVALYGTIGRY